MKLTTKGFTLIELLVVVLIIGILAAVALPQYNKAVKKAQGTEALIAIDTLDKALTNYYMEHDTYENVNKNSLNIDLPELKHFKYEVGCGCSYENSVSQFQDDVFVHAGDRLYIGIKSPHIVITGQYRDGKRAWECSPMNESNCADYFNCNTSPREMIAVGSWKGGNCWLKGNSF